MENNNGVLKENRDDVIALFWARIISRYSKQYFLDFLKYFCQSSNYIKKNDQFEENRENVITLLGKNHI